MVSQDLSSSLNPYHNNYESIIAFDIASIVISIALTSLRFYVRRCIVKKVDWDDWLLIVSVTFFTARCITDILGFVSFRDHGFANGNPYALMMGTVTVELHIMHAIFVKAAYAAFYLRIIPVEIGFRWHRIIIIVAFTVFTANITSRLILNLFKCGAPANLADIPAHRCLKSSTQGVLYNIAYAFDIWLDWTLALTAMDVVRRTVHNKKTRASVIAVLSLGCVASIMAILPPALNPLIGTAIGGRENLRIPIIVDILVTCEALLSIVCLCLIALKPLFQTKIGPLLNKGSQTSSYTLPTLPRLDTLSDQIDPSLHTLQVPKGPGCRLLDSQQSTVRLDSVVETRSAV